MVDWELTEFTVEVSDPASRADRLYANGRMRVPVYAKLRAAYKDTGKPYRLTANELSDMLLVYYHRPEAWLQPPWIVDSDRGEYGGTLSATTANAQHSPQESQADDTSPQYRTFWVSTTANEALAIGAGLIMPNSDTIITTNDGNFNSYVTLTGIPPITYTTANTTLKPTPDSPHTGRVWGNLNGRGTVSADWRQTNYSFTPNTHGLHKAELHWYERTGHDNGSGDDDKRLIGSYMKSCTNNYTWNGDIHDETQLLDLYYIWETGAQSTKTVGHQLPIYESYLPFYTDITVNNTPDALCLTHIQFSMTDVDYEDIFYPYWSFNTWFVLYDIYGNRGVFEATSSEDTGEVIIRNSNRTLTDIAEEPTVTIRRSSKAPAQKSEEASAPAAV